MAFWSAAFAEGMFPVAAYIDPGAGSLILQIILGGVAGAFVAFKLLWRRIAARFHRDPEK